MANYIDTAIQQLVTMFGDCAKIKKLWTNASPTSNFAAQTISLDLSDYDFVKIEYLMATDGKTDGVYNYNYVYACECPVGKTCILDFVGSQYGGTSYTPTSNARRAKVIETGIQFGTAIQKAMGSTTATTNSNTIIPFAIYGVKGVI